MALGEVEQGESGIAEGRAMLFRKIMEAISCNHDRIMTAVLILYGFVLPILVGVCVVVELIGGGTT